MKRNKDISHKHPLIAVWLNDKWEVAIPESKEDAKQLLAEGFEVSAALYGVFYKRIGVEIDSNLTGD